MGRSMQEILIFNAFMEHTRDSIVIKEYFANERGEFTGGKIICASSTKARHYGLNMSTIRGCTDFDLLPREQAEKALQDDLWVMKNRKPIEDQRETITHKNGEIVKVSVTKFPWVLPSGEIVGVMCIARNITIRERAKQQTQDLVVFMRRYVLKPLLPIYQNDLENRNTRNALKPVIFRLMKKLREVNHLKA
ncbi:MAG: PAS domain-containing protein [Oryzomonas sp.]|uniref:PAS domain-containing protein n=1 Tax=Oryzomonas sp. TaxID=2855186 RepID=UPI00284502EC|nr:PAS domain-containing protein [Oryzomonas sp.]MDR3578624.1 PAS domain-containing protein [Oryzomonas sp.]